MGLADLGVPEEGGPLYELALTHRSHAFEQPDPGEHNERLEFLGDAILGAVVTDFLYKEYRDLPEGDLARLRASVVNSNALAEIAAALELGPWLRLGKGEEASGGRFKASLLADTLEAVIGAVYIERGIEAVRASLLPLFVPRVRAALEAGSRYDAKTALQEIAVRDTGVLPSYRLASSGPDHDKRFTAQVYIAADLCGEGAGRSKKEAEQKAAAAALGRLVPAATTARADILDEGGRGARAS